MRGLALALAVLFAPAAARAGAWPMPGGLTQTILKYENGRADEGFLSDGGTTPIPKVKDDDVSLFVEHGLTDRLTLQGDFDATRGDDGYQQHDGRGPMSLGLRYTFLVTDEGRQVFSLYAGATYDGVGRNAAYAAPDRGHTDAELRGLYGRSAKLFGREAFFDGEVARLFRSALADETHVDLTFGYEVRRNWQVLVQSYLGEADTQPKQARWAKVEVGVVRRFGHWRVQAGWRQTVAGRLVPVENGPVVALWRTF